MPTSSASEPTPSDIPDDSDSTARCVTLTAEQPPSDSSMSEELAALRVENRCLRERIQLLLRERFGAKSEELDRAQLLLMLQGPDGLGKSSEPVAAEAPRRSQD